MTPGSEDFAAARRDGRREAERLDDELRAIEKGERAARWALLAAADRQPADPDEPPRLASQVEIDRLRREVEALAAFQKAVHRSRPWRAAQFLRRLVGRAW